jgi:2'-5' RNA ligase
MTLMLKTTPGYRLNEYKLVIPLPDALQQKISAIRTEFGENYSYKPDQGRVHITLVMFSQLEMMEDKIKQRLKSISMGEAPFKIELRDYGDYPSHTIYINIATREPVKKLMRSVREIQNILRTDKEHKAHFLQDPVLSIARKLKPWQYEKAWLEYSHRQFTGRFIADALLLLKRPEGSIPWQIVERMELQNLPVIIRQGGLF